MSRTRSFTLAPQPLTTSDLGQYLAVWHKTEPNTKGFVKDVVDKSYMQDELSPPGSVRPFNPCEHTRYTGSMLKVDDVFVNYPGSVPDRHWKFAGCVGYHNSSASVPTDMWSALINDLASKVNGFVEPQSLLAVSLWELRKTYAMIRNPFSLMKADWRARAGMHPARALVKRASDLWLEGRYGWKALFYDLRGISAGLAKITTQNPHQALEGMLERWSVTQSGQCSLPTTIYPYGGSDSYWNSLVAARNAGTYDMIDLFRVKDYHANWKLTVGCKQRLAAVNDLRLWTQKFQTFGLDRHSILSTLWELIPYSFVVDWFIDTQSIWSPLSMARLAAPDIRDLGCSTTIEEGYRVEYFPVYDPWKYVPPWNYSYPQLVTGGGPISGTRGKTKTYVRNLGLPSLSTILTIFKSKGLNSFQLTSGTALVIQQLNNLFEAAKRVKTRRSR